MTHSPYPYNGQGHSMEQQRNYEEWQRRQSAVAAHLEALNDDRPCLLWGPSVRPSAVPERDWAFWVSVNDETIIRLWAADLDQ